MTVTKEEFDLYEGVRQSGVTNMFAVNVVQDLTGLSRDKILESMQNYAALKEKHGGKTEK